MTHITDRDIENTCILAADTAECDQAIIEVYLRNDGTLGSRILAAQEPPALSGRAIFIIDADHEDPPDPDKVNRDIRLAIKRYHELNP